MRMLGRALQMLGLIVLPLSMLMQVTDLLGRAIGVSQMVFMMLFGVVAFLLGRMIEGYSTPPA